MNLDLENKTVLVTGASGGLGRAVAEAFAAEGAHLALTYHQARDEALALADGLQRRHGTRCTVSAFELGRLASARAVVADALTLGGRVDVLVNNAVRFGAHARGGAGFDDIDEADWTAVLRDNVEGAIQLARLVAPLMRAQGWGRQVHVSSRAASMGMAGNEYYAAAKMALAGFSRSLAYSLGAAGNLLSNVVEPGFTRTERNQGQGQRMEAAIAGMTPMGRLLRADEVARSIVYLGSGANAGITGQVIVVSGGL